MLAPLASSRVSSAPWISAFCLLLGSPVSLASCSVTTTTSEGAGDDATSDEADEGTQDSSGSETEETSGRDSTSEAGAASSSEVSSGEVDATTDDDNTSSTSTTSADATSTSTDSTTAAETESAEEESTGTQPACDASAAPAITQLGLETVVQSDELTILVYAAQPPGSEDWYLVDALGYVYVYSGGQFQTTPFLDLTSLVQDSTFSGNDAPSGGASNYDERGLLSIAFPPDYEESGKFYVTIIPTTTSSADVDHDLVLEYTRSAENPLVADTSTRRAIVDLEPGGQGYSPGPGVNLAKYHNGSTVLFGPDGMLYFGLGDGGGECNSARAGVPQDTTSPYGKILRLDPNAEPPYAAAGNPFAADGDPRVLHWGLRNPFRFSFDSFTGDLYIGDVGQWNNEEISFAPAGAQGLNFGWPDFESVNGSSCTTPNVPLAPGATHTPPIFDLPHVNGGAQSLLTTIVGGSVYRGSAIPDLRGAYIFAEFYPNGAMRALYQCGDQTSEVTEIKKRCDPNQPNAACFQSLDGDNDLVQVGAIVQGNDGELYIAANGNALLKIVPAP